MSDYMDFDEEDSIEEQQTIKSEMSGKQILSKSGLYLSLMIFAIYVVQFLISIMVGTFFADYLEAGWINIALTAIGIVGVGFPVFKDLMNRLPDSDQGEARNLSFKQFIGYFIVCIGAMYISNFIGIFINTMIELIKGTKVVNPIEDLILNGNMLITMLYASLVAPVVEELIFRKILLDKLRRLGDLPAILITGIAFGLFHMNLAQFLYAAVLGFILAYITIRTNRIIYAILLHMMMNFIGTGIVPLIMAKESILGTVLIVVWVYGTMTLGAVLMIINSRKVVLNKAEHPMIRGRDYILNKGTILFLVICIGIIILGLF